MQTVRDGDTELPDYEEVSSTKVDVRELHGVSRCLPCQGAGRECHVKPHRPTCLECQVADSCQFRRIVVNVRRCNEWAWRDLVGDTDHSVEPKRSYAVPDTVPRKRPWESTTEVPPQENFPPPPPPPLHRMQGELPPLAQDMSGQARYSSLPPIRHHSIHEIPKPNDELRPRSTRNSESSYSTVPPARKYDVTPAMPVTSPVTPARNEMSCQQCNIQFATKSERMKHMSRHERVFVCDVVGCSRTQGFTTQNDLDRHKRTVHRVSGGRYWKCFFPECPKAAKLWPRLDNFRAHIIRMHGADHADDYVRRADEWWEEEQSQQIQYSKPSSASRPREATREKRLTEALIRPVRHESASPVVAEVFWDYKETKDAIGPSCLDKINWTQSDPRPKHGDMMDMKLSHQDFDMTIPLTVFVNDYCKYDILLGHESRERVESEWSRRNEIKTEAHQNSQQSPVKEEKEQRSTDSEDEAVVRQNSLRSEKIKSDS